ncbi:MAG: SDR family oxidoreductase [Sphingobacteriales bacterium]|jgi:UDP-glucose 4-epimerase|nr:SDR family oxidoreductase [Sphingobacteriales bacterium]
MGKSILVTGAEGYLGRLVVQMLAQTADQYDAIIAHDIKKHPTSTQSNNIHYVQGDIRDSGISNCIEEYAVDTVIHLASIVTPGKKSNREFEYSVDVTGTANLLKACVQHHVKQFIITSSGAAYGYYRDNPTWLTETDAIRGNEEFAYSCHKRLVEEMLASYRDKYPEMLQLILRPGTILGEQTNNQITDLFNNKYIIGIRGAEIPFVFIWDQDVAAIIIKGVREEKSGIYNLAGDGFLTIEQIAKKLGKPHIKFPAIFLKAAFFLLHRLGWSQYSPGQVNFLRYRPVLSNQKLKEEFGYTPKYTSEEVFDFYLKTNYLPSKKRKL